MYNNIIYLYVFTLSMYMYMYYTQKLWITVLKCIVHFVYTLYIYKATCKHVLWQGFIRWGICFSLGFVSQNAHHNNPIHVCSPPSFSNFASPLTNVLNESLMVILVFVLWACILLVTIVYKSKVIGVHILYCLIQTTHVHAQQIFCTPT